ILRYLEAQYEATLLEESKVKRNPKSPDYQTHACLYFLDPQLTHACGGLTPIDHLVLKELCPRVNIIPVIAKVDLLTVRQLKSLRASILKDIEEHDLKIFNFPDDPEEEDEEMAAINAELRSFAPFAVVNSEEENGHVGLIIENERILCRQYLWGLVEVQNEDHCDFLRLKQAVFGTHMNELRVTTREIFYEAWRTEKLL
ncbi:Septin-type guanine nucleotide-binding (G) domain-containing protein, partial [Polychytrium aggregatum]|uniref:Septin-type guanine nucleotide-binding (G) domain-containing protein n=1 Tax=Polychytrium aggregatum TaxID=110093 RepID=UPI0022FDFA04